MEQEHNIEEVSRREVFKDLALNYEEEFLGILDAYKEHPEEFRKQLSFGKYLSIVSSRINIDELTSEDTSEDVEEVELKNPCNRCEEKEKHPLDRDFCSSCMEELQKEAEETKERMISELKNDSEFLRLTTKTDGETYVKHKFKDEQKKNKYIYLTTFSREAVSLKHQNLL